MNNILSSFEDEISKLEKMIKKGSAKTVSDRKTRDSLKTLAAMWFYDIKPIVDNLLPTSTDLYELDNIVDSLMDFSNRTVVRNSLLKELRAFLRGVQRNVTSKLLKITPKLGTNNQTVSFVDTSKLIDLRKYLSEIIRQINSTYEQMCPDACALLIRKLFEVMLCDYYYIKNIQANVIDKQGNWKHLKTIINHFIDHSGEQPSPTLRTFLNNSRLFGGTAAHNYRITLSLKDIEKHLGTIELSIRELHQIVYTP